MNRTQCHTISSILGKSHLQLSLLAVSVNASFHAGASKQTSLKLEI